MTTPCIEWKGKKNANGYGIIRINDKQFFVHRLAVALSGRNIPKSKVCDHLCRNHACYNPEHLELVSPKENSLRGVSPPARMARRDACDKGHAYTPENTRLFTDKRGKKARHCKRCYADREYAHKRRSGKVIGKGNWKRLKYEN